MSAHARILVVEDEPRLGELLRLYLERDGHAVTVVGDGRAAIDAVEADGVDLVVLDLMLPGLGGEAVLEAIRDRGDIPVLIASAKRSDAERIAGLRMGADDYLAKPFNPHELTARVAAILRRSGRRTAASAGRAATATRPPLARRRPPGRRPGEPPVSPLGGGRRAPASGRLTPGEAGLLGALARRPGSVLTREQLLDAVTRRPDESTIGSWTSTSRTCGASSATTPARRGSSRRSRRSAIGWSRPGSRVTEASPTPPLAWRLGPASSARSVLGVLLVAGRRRQSRRQRRLRDRHREPAAAAPRRRGGQPRRPARPARPRPAPVVRRLANNLGGEVRVISTDGTTLTAFGRQPDGDVAHYTSPIVADGADVATLEADLPAQVGDRGFLPLFNVTLLVAGVSASWASRSPRPTSRPG